MQRAQGGVIHDTGLAQELAKILGGSFEQAFGAEGVEKLTPHLAAAKGLGLGLAPGAKSIPTRLLHHHYGTSGF